MNIYVNFVHYKINSPRFVAYYLAIYHLIASYNVSQIDLICLVSSLELVCAILQYHPRYSLTDLRC